MPDEIESGEEIDQSGADYIEAIKTMRENSVSKEDYTRLKEENKQLLQALVNGETIEVSSDSVDVSELRKQLYQEENSFNNLETITKTLQLRDAIIASGGVDPFLPYGKQILPTEDDIKTANHVAEVLKECVEYADGDNDVFTNEIQRRLVDVTPMAGKKRK